MNNIPELEKKIAQAYEKQIARAIHDAQEMREESYVPKEVKWGDGDQLIHCGEYKLTIEECLIATCKKHKLSDNFWALLNLAMHWWNDIQLWADDVLADKNILDECEKVKAKMKDEMKQKGEIDCSRCDHSSDEACDQCQETDLANPNNH